MNKVESTQLDVLLESLKEKYKGRGQDLESHLHGLLHRKGVAYWEYTHLDTLLSLQHPQTEFKDEMVFIMYHQITELYFRLVLHELEQIMEQDPLDPAFFVERIHRVNRYFGNLVHSFAVMRDGMDRDQYLEFRMALIPASGFQSFQYRKVEIACTELKNLLNHRAKGKMDETAGIDKLLDNIYWMDAGLNRETGEKTQTLKWFEKKYSEELKEWAEKCKSHNMMQRFLSLSEADRAKPELIDALRALDKAVNLDWPLVHMTVAQKYLGNDEEAKEATGGSDWRKYLHPKYQRRIFFPTLWSEEELANWGTK